MTTTYDPATTALLCIDFYNDFLSEGGKLWPWVKDVAEEVNLLNNLRGNGTSPPYTSLSP